MRWLGLVGRPRTFGLIRREYDPAVNELFDPYNATALRGLIWPVALTPPDPKTARVLGGIVETALQEVPGTGPRSPKIANGASVPAGVRANYADELKDLKATVKNVERMLSAQADRLDRQLLARRVCGALTRGGSGTSTIRWSVRSPAG